MTDSTWPNEPYRRKALLVLNQEKIDALRFKEGGSDLLRNEEVYILPSSLQELNPIVQDLADSGLIRPDAVLIQNPFDKNIYENSTQAVERFALEKYMHFSKLCMYLGAREVSVEQIVHKNIEGEETYSIGGSISMKGSGNIKIKNKEIDSLRSQRTLKNTFVGGEPDVQAARELLKQTGLSGDPNMRALIDLRRNPNNLLTSQDIRMNVTSEVKRNLNVLADLMPAYISVSLEAGYDRHVREQTEFTLTIKVDF